MGAKTWWRVSWYDRAKLLGASVLMFLALVLYPGKAGENYTFIQKEYLSGSQSIKNQETDQEHQSASGSFFSHSSSWLSFSPLEELCMWQEIFCKKVVYTWDIGERNKMTTTEQYLDIINFLDQRLLKGNSVKTHFKWLVLNGEKGKRRWGATWAKITMNLASLAEMSEYRGVLTHEFGHIVDLGLLQGLSKTKDQNFTEFGKVKFSVDDPSLVYYRYSRDSETIRKPMSKKGDFCSGYGMTNPFEDFAECLNLYLNNNLLFQSMAQESEIMIMKYNFLANLFDGSMLRDNEHPYFFAGRRPWDTTVI